VKAKILSLLDDVAGGEQIEITTAATPPRHDLVTFRRMAPGSSHSTS
jgi:antitoxin (DNA-binding transcriptional repressor) of toxin-antitoxin stability system